MQKSKKFTLRPNAQDIDMAINTIVNRLYSLSINENIVNTHELIIRQLTENGLRYGNFSHPESEITINIHIAVDSIIYEVISPVDPKFNQNLEKLDGTIQLIKGFQDPYEAFIIKHKKDVKNSYDDEMGSGLARIAYICNVDLDFIIDEDNNLVQSAVRKLERPSNSASLYH